MNEIYFDNSATTKPLPEVKKTINETLTNNYGNPSSLHQKGLNAEKQLKKGRKIISQKLKTNPGKIYFTSGGTESNNLAIKGTVYSYQNRGNHLITTQIEHASVLNVFQALEKEGFEVTYLKPDTDGKISIEDLKKSLRTETIMVSIMHTNNEIGTIQPVKEAAAVINNYNKDIFFHVDAVQSLGKILVKPEAWNIDFLSISGHKLHGPKGVGALFINNKKSFTPLFNGGGQEDGIRSGTENLPGIAGMTAAVKDVPEFNEKHRKNEYLNNLKTYFIDKLKENFNDIRINTPENNSAPHIVNISIRELRGEVIVHALEEDNIYVSTGSACSSRKEDTSNVLQAIGVPPEYIKGTIRISFSKFNKQKEIDKVIKSLKEKLDFLRI